jgi:dCMP deaminase
VTSWDQYFTDLLGPVAAKSKDRSRKIGCIIVGPDHEIRTTGYNNPPRGADDSVEARYERPEKYYWFEHSERNAIYNAARMGTPLAGCTAYVSLFPCMDCARGIVQAGIVEVIAPAPDMTDPVWAEHFERTMLLFSETGVRVRYSHERT